MRDFQSFSDAWSFLHGDVKVRGAIKMWLKFSYRAALVLSKLKVNANFLTTLGIGFSAGAALSSPREWCAGLLALSIFSDGVDGSLALIQKRESVMGAMFDSVADRLSDGLWAIVFYRLGVPIQLVIAAWVFASVQEFARARLGSDGVKEIGIVSISERPVRGLLILFAVIIYQFNLSAEWILAIAWWCAIMQFIALGQVLAYARTSLK